jgi:phosphoribosylamine-glycine ligase
MTLGQSIGIQNPTEESRGFTPDGKLFLNRTQALGFLKKYDRTTYNELTSDAQQGLHSEHLAAAYGVPQKAAATAQTSPSSPKQPATHSNPPAKNKSLSQGVKLSDLTAIVYDRGGLYLYCAEKLAEKYKKVMYYLADADAYPTSQKHTIGMGIKNVKRIHDFWKNIDKVDIVYFFDCYDGELQHWLREKGYTVFGSGRGEQVEIDKIKFLELLEELGLPCAETYLAEGMDDLCEYLKEHDGKTLFLKNLHRGDFESRKFSSMAQSRPFLNDLKKRLGSASDTLEVLVQHKIDAECEVGYDGFQVDGEFTKNCIVGYEIKDKGFVGKIFTETPDIVKGINDAFTSTFKKLGYRGAYSTELRITKDGTPYYIDATCRVPSPPGELLCELYENWAEATYSIACGELPELEPKAKYGAEVILTSGWHENHELHVKFPKKHSQNIKLKNHTTREGEFYCVPNNNGPFFGSAVAWGDTLEEAVEKVKEIAKSIEADELEYDSSLFDKANEQIKAGEKFGITF